MATRFNRYWVLIVIFLVAIIVVGSVVAWSRYNPGQPIEIAVSASRDLEGEVYISGAVSNPGFYPLKVGESIESLIQAAGGITSKDGLFNLKIFVAGIKEEIQPQKIDTGSTLKLKLRHILLSSFFPPYFIVSDPVPRAHHLIDLLDHI